MTHGSRSYLGAAAAVLVAALALAGCGGSDSSTPTTAGGQPATLGVEGSDLGDILVNSKGRTLYLFQRDSGTQSACTAACATSWPPFRAAGKPVVGTGANASLVGTTTRPDGSAQLTYNGHPLYLFSGDNGPGDTNGQGSTAFGGGWFALSGSGNQVSGTGTGGGYGY